MLQAYIGLPPVSVLKNQLENSFKPYHDIDKTNKRDFVVSVDFGGV
jgi:hypothetical protein